MENQETNSLTTTEGVHSIKGASGAERWMNCTGSTALIQALDLPPTDEPDYRREGIAGHEAAADCLARDIDTWEIVGETYYNTEIDKSMAEAIQMYLDRVRPSIDRERGYHGTQFFIEAKLAAPDVHEAMFGTVDFAALADNSSWRIIPMALVPGSVNHVRFLDVTDLKMGEGIAVDAEDNPQMKYYAFMLIHTKFAELEDDFPVRLTIVQPRAFHFDGPIREWWTTVGEIKAWVTRDLLPAMENASSDLWAGHWCRFCPAKIVCPLLTSLFRAAAHYDPTVVVDAGDKALGLAYNMIDPVKFYIKAVEEEAFRRLQLGRDVEGTKLVNKKANRIFKNTVTAQVEGKDTEVDLVEHMKRTFGADAFTKPELKSPAEFSKVSPAAKAFVQEYAYMPVTGLTVARLDDKRLGVKVQTVTERVGADVIARLAEATGDDNE